MFDSDRGWALGRFWSCAAGIKREKPRTQLTLWETICFSSALVWPVFRHKMQTWTENVGMHVWENGGVHNINPKYKAMFKLHFKVQYTWLMWALHTTPKNGTLPGHSTGSCMSTSTFMYATPKARAEQCLIQKAQQSHYSVCCVFSVVFHLLMSLWI